MATAGIKVALHRLAEMLPEDATWRDVAYEAYMHQEMEAGLAEARRGELAEESEVKIPSRAGACRLLVTSLGGHERRHLPSFTPANHNRQAG